MARRWVRKRCLYRGVDRAGPYPRIRELIIGWIDRCHGCRRRANVLWENAGLESVDTRVIRIPTVYSDFDDFWDSNLVPIGPQGKIFAGMSASAREELRTRLRDHLPVSSDGRIVYESFANAVKGRVPA